MSDDDLDVTDDSAGTVLTLTGETYVYSEDEDWHSVADEHVIDQEVEVPDRPAGGGASFEETRIPPADPEDTPRPVKSMRSEEAPRPLLVSLRGRRAGKMTLLERGSYALGRARDTVDVWFSDPAVSRRHAALKEIGDGSYRIRDLGSSNGTYVNRRRVDGSRRLDDGDKIVLSKRAVIKYSVVDSIERDFHERMYESAVRDGLTDANTRAYLEEQMRSEMVLVERYGSDQQAALLLIDLDDFRSVNDEHGHPVGDSVLAAVADRCRTVIRGEDVFARYGGDEFAVLLRKTQREAVGEIAERIRAAVQSEPLLDGEIALDQTISVGGALCDLSEFQTVREWIEKTDRALYRAKAAGRNCAYIYHSVDDHR